MMSVPMNDIAVKRNDTLVVPYGFAAENSISDERR